MNASRLGSALWLVAVMGCATAGRGPGATAARHAAEFYPLAVGNAWTYHVKMLGQAQVVEVKVLSEEGGFFIDSTGARLTADAYGVRDDKRYLLRDPVEVGTTWNNVVSVSSMEQYRIAEVGVHCTVAAGSFDDCVVVEAKNHIAGNKTLINEMTFVPRVGLVRVATSLEIETRREPQTSLELDSYSLQGADVSAGTTPPAGGSAR